VVRVVVSASFAAAWLLTLGVGAHGQSVPPDDLRSPDPRIWIEPRDPAVTTDASVVLTAYVLTKDRPPMKLTDAEWAVSGDSSSGTVTPSGVYTAPSVAPDNPPKLTVKSSSFKITADVTVTINVPSCDIDQHSNIDPAAKLTPCVKLDPLTNIVRVWDSVDLSAEVLHLPNATIAWQIKVDDKVVYEKDVDEKDESAGKLTGTAGIVKYMAPGSVPLGKVTVSAVAKLNGSKTKTAATAAMIVVAPYASVHCPTPDAKIKSPRCKIIPFDRLDGPTGTFTIADPATGIVTKQRVQDSTPASWVQAVTSSKALSTGTVLEVDIPKSVRVTNCKNYDWKVVTQTEESPNILTAVQISRD
jgi:hypothetical protein